MLELRYVVDQIVYRYLVTNHNPTFQMQKQGPVYMKKSWPGPTGHPHPRANLIPRVAGL